MKFLNLESMSTKERSIILLLVILICSGVIYYAVYSRVEKKFRNIENQIADYEDALREKKADLDSQKETEAEYNTAAASLSISPSDNEATDNLYLDINNIAKDSNVECPSMGQRPAVTNAAYHKYYVDIGKYEADTSSLIKFLHKVSMSPDFTRVDVIEINCDPRTKMLSGKMQVSRIMLAPELSK